MIHYKTLAFVSSGEGDGPKLQQRDCSKPRSEGPWQTRTRECSFLATPDQRELIGPWARSALRVSRRHRTLHEGWNGAAEHSANLCLRTFEIPILCQALTRGVGRVHAIYYIRSWCE